MRATIIVRDLQADKIVKLLDVCSIDEATVNTAVRQLKEQFSDICYWVDTRQVEYARESQAA